MYVSRNGVISDCMSNGIASTLGFIFAGKRFSVFCGFFACIISALHVIDTYINEMLKVQRTANKCLHHNIQQANYIMAEVNFRDGKQR